MSNTARSTPWNGKKEKGRISRNVLKEISIQTVWSGVGEPFAKATLMRRFSGLWILPLNNRAMTYTRTIGKGDLNVLTNGAAEPMWLTCLLDECTYLMRCVVLENLNVSMSHKPINITLVCTMLSYNVRYTQSSKSLFPSWT